MIDIVATDDLRAYNKVRQNPSSFPLKCLFVWYYYGGDTYNNDDGDDYDGNNNDDGCHEQSREGLVAMKKDKRARGIYTVIWILSSETIFQLNQLFSNSEARTREPAGDINNPMFATALQVFRRPPLIQRFLFSCNVFFHFPKPS